MEEKQFKRTGRLLTNAGILLFVAIYCLMMHGMRRDVIAPSAYRFIESVRILACLVMLPVLLFGIDWAAVKRWKAERVFLLVYIPISLLMMFVMPILRAPDELEHLKRAYLIAEGHMLPSAEPVSYPENINDWGESDQSITLSQLARLRDTVFSEEKTEAVADIATGIYPVNNYFPQALGIAAAKLLTNNRIIIFYAARFGAWLATLLLFYCAIRMTPAKSALILLMISLFPMTLQEAVSAAADGMTIAIVACMTAFVFRARREKYVFRVKDYAGLVGLSIGVVVFKVMYLPFLFLVLLIPGECFGGGEKKRRRVLGLTIAAALALIVVWMVLCKHRLIDQGNAQRGNYIIPQIVYILKHPVRYLITIMRTLSNNFSEFFMDIFGYNLSWYNLQMQSLLIYGIMLLFVAFCLRGLEENKPVQRDHAVCVLTGVLTAVTVMFIFLFLYVWWSGYQAQIVGGIQGRYFIPVLFPVIAAARYGQDTEKRIPAGNLWMLKWIVALDALILMQVLTYTI